MKKQNRNPNKSAYELSRDYSKNNHGLNTLKQTNDFHNSVISKSNYKPKFIIKQSIESKPKYNNLQQVDEQQNLHPGQTFTSTPTGNSQVILNRIKFEKQQKDYAMIRTRRSQKVGVTRTYQNSQVNFYNPDEYQISQHSRDQDLNNSIQKSKYSMKNEANINYKLLYLQAKKQLQVRTAYFNEAVGLWTQILGEMNQNLEQDIDENIKLRYIKNQCKALIQTFQDYQQN